ncbi:MAG: enolase C-terminal domain-like protein, partial [Acidobacteriota bacterium]
MASTANANEQWDQRMGLLLAVLADDERIGAGEATPLPGYSPESFFKAWSALGTWAEAAEGRELFDLDDVAAMVSVIPVHLPSVRFAVETALLDLLAQKERCPIADVLARGDYGPGLADADVQVPTTLPVATLVSVDGPGYDDPVAVARRHLDHGVAALKIKVGRDGRFDDERRGLDALRSALGDAWELRLDANGAFPIASVDQCLTSLAEFTPSFIEEPLSGGDLFVVCDPPIPVALDETF